MHDFSKGEKQTSIKETNFNNQGYIEEKQRLGLMQAHRCASARYVNVHKHNIQLLCFF